MAAMREATALLERAGVPSAAHDARVLLAHARATDTDPGRLLAQRAARVPLQHLIGSTGFRYLDVAVGPGVFVPRPETELVAEAALAALRGIDRPVAVDLCAGSGAIGLSLAGEHPGVTVHLVECDPAAYEWLLRNCAARNGADSSGAESSGADGDRVHSHLGDLDDQPLGLDGGVDLVVANPPYLPETDRAVLAPEVAGHDPALALWGGPDGLDVVRRVAARAVTLLRPGGTLVVEHDDSHLATAPEVLRAAGYVDVVDHADLTGRPRFVVGRRP